MMLKFELKDCMLGMAEYPDKYFGLAIVDPPYGFGEKICNLRNRSAKWNSSPPEETYFVELKRVSKNQIIWGANYFNCFNGKMGAIIWNKNQPMPDFSKAEIASNSLHKKIEIYNQTWTNYVNEKETSNETEKPVALYRWLLQNYAKPGDIILDTHVGSASSLIACEMEGFEYVGFELDEDYYKAATERIKRFRMQPDIFRPQPERTETIQMVME